jgi:hypothetical protein
MLPFLPYLAVGLGSLFGGMASSAIANAGNRKLQREQNEYNDPQNQVMRLQRAGLNPLLAYGHGGSSNAGNQSSYAPTVAPELNFHTAVGNYINLVSQTMQLEQIQHQNQLLDSQSVLARSQSQYYEALAPKTKEQVSLTRAQTGLARAQTGLAGQQTGVASIQRNISSHNLNIAQERGRQTTDSSPSPINVIGDILSRSANFIYRKFLPRSLK